MSLNRKQRRAIGYKAPQVKSKEVPTLPVPLAKVPVNVQSVNTINRNMRKYDPAILSLAFKEKPQPPVRPQINATMANHSLKQHLTLPMDVSRGEGRKLTNNLMVCMIGLPAIVCHEYYHYDDQKISDIVDEIIEYYDGMFKDYFDFDDVDMVLSEEANLVISDVAEKMNVSKSSQDQTFLIVIGTAVMTMLDKFGFDSEKCKDFTEKLIYKYDHYKRGFITNYELGKFLKAHANVVLEKKEM